MEVVPFLESAFRMSILQQSSGKYFNFIREVIITSILLGFDQKNLFFLGVFLVQVQ